MDRYLIKYIYTGFVFWIVLLISYKLLHITVEEQPQLIENEANVDFENRKTISSSILILYWTRVFDDIVNVTDKPHEWPFFSVGKNCPSKCELTNNKSRLGEASALVIHGRNIDEIPSGKTKSLPWIFHVNENPQYTTVLRSKQVMKKFNYLASYRLDSDFPCPEFIQPDLTKPISFNRKSGLVIAIYSNCEDIRTLYIFRLMKHINIDSYGRCLQNKPRFPKDRKNKSKVQELMRYYKFALVFPNADCDYYMTEKIYNVLSAGSVPVWMGTDQIDEVLQWGNLKSSVIKVKDYSTPKHLASYLMWLAANENEYNKYLRWKYKNFQFPTEYYKSPIGQWWEGLSLYCRVCMKLANGERGHNGLVIDSCNGKQRRTLEKWIRE